VSILKGKNLLDLLRNTWEDACIEDARMRFFCVSTNVTKNLKHIHHTGPVWEAIRTSTAIPGLFPPVYSHEGDMLVDGGVINNLPVDVMRDMISDGTVIASNCIWGDHCPLKNPHKDYWLSGWKLLFDGLNPFNNEIPEYHRIYSIILSSFSTSSSLNVVSMENKADCVIRIPNLHQDILNFSDYNVIITAGYEAAKVSLQELSKGARI
jgi:predicted acylesterase/phospholipase RssA